MEKIRVYLEIKKDSNIKYEFDKTKNELVVDRILPDPYYYPFSYFAQRLFLPKMYYLILL